MIADASVADFVVGGFLVVGAALLAWLWLPGKKNAHRP